ncbi:MAG: N-acetylmuramoyl-L-alanine amidase [Rhodoferax sp.]|nr:N-acetylmuramoyl-L-alanine amidase [Rhodoferax sp.]
MSLPRNFARLVLALIVALLAGCATQYDTTYSSVSQGSRVRYLIIHYTVLDLPTSIRVLTQQAVSSHYLVSDQPDARIYLLVDESRRANHAGLSSWKGDTNLNPSSIGIEIVNLGYQKTENGPVYYPFPQPQIDKVIELVRQITKRHDISPDRVLGHSDIAPLRKQDPGPMFPWKQLADAGLVLWPDAQKVAERRAGYEALLPDVAWFQKRLETHGFVVPQTGVLDEPTRTVIAAFQMKYRNSNYDGNPDGETAAILDVLTAPPVRR